MEKHIDKRKFRQFETTFTLVEDGNIYRDDFNFLYSKRNFGSHRSKIEHLYNVEEVIDMLSRVEKKMSTFMIFNKKNFYKKCGPNFFQLN